MNNSSVKEQLNSKCELALELINDSEAELNRVLAYGERKSLLLANTNWTNDGCAYIINVLKQRGAI